MEASRGARLSIQRLAKECRSRGSVGFKIAFALYRDAAGIVNFLQCVEESTVVVIFGEIVRPQAAVGIGEVEVHDFFSCRFENAWIFVFFAQMIVVDDHAHVRVLYRADHLQSLGSSVENIAFLMSQWLD